LLWTCAEAVFALDFDRTLDQYIVTRWSSRDSFPGGAIHAIAQTPDGFLWLGAENGLVRYDGVGFRRIDNSNTTSFPPGDVLGLAVDEDGLLWLRMQSPHLLRYRHGSFEQMYPEVLPTPFSAAREHGATVLTRGTRGDILIAAPGSPLRYAAGKFTPAGSTGGRGGLPISIAETADGTVWVGMLDTGLYAMKNSGGSQMGLPDQKITVLLAGAGRELWIGTDSGLFRWDGSTISRRGIPGALTRNPILALARDRDSNLWISTPDGVTRMSSSGATLQTAGGGLPGAVHSIFEDREGNLWFGGTQGLMQLRDAPFMRYSGVAGEGGSLHIDGTGRAWIGPANGGLISIRGVNHQPITGLGMDRDVIYSITGGAGEIWVGRRIGVTQLREVNGVLHPRTFTVRDGLAPGVISAVYRARDESVWAGTLNGAVSRIERGRVTNFPMGSDAITTIHETPGGVIWVGTSGGLWTFRDETWRRYGGDDGLPPGRVNSLALDGGGVLWIGTAAGLFYWSEARIESPRNAPDTLHGEIYGLAADNSGNLWAATERHVISIERDSLLGHRKGAATVREFGSADGLPSTRGIRRDHSVARDPSGHIWFSLQGGLCVVNPSLPSAVAPALVTVESVKVDDHPLDTGPGARFPSSRRRVVFNFVGVSLTVPGRVRYRYMLDGYDGDWSQPTESREVAYTSLSPARYTFRVMASNSEGMWNGAPASVPFEVDPRLSETWWFRAMGLCLLAGGVFGGFRYRLARVNAALNLRFEERLAERTRIARELHDTLLQSFQGLMLRLQVVDDLLPPGKAKEQLEASLERADQAIAEGRSALYDLRSSATATNDLAQAVRALGDEMATQDSKPFHLVVEGRTRNLHPIIRDELYRITREALRNAFNHAAARHIETEITYGERAFRLRIRDDGRGIPTEMMEAGRPGHYGISGMRERAAQIGARLEIWSGPNAGTEIELSIPASTAYRTPTDRPLFKLFRRKQVEL
jgi:signal transduction histidine kinase/ligand-binding sensor domain-containing protein